METAWNLKQEGRTGSIRRAGEAHRCVGELLLTFGVAPHFCGFDPICGGVRIRSEGERRGNAPALKVLSHETAIREAIGRSFLRADEIHKEVFPFSDRPSGSEFVCTLAELVRDRLGKEE